VPVRERGGRSGSRLRSAKRQVTDPDEPPSGETIADEPGNAGLGSARALRTAAVRQRPAHACLPRLPMTAADLAFAAPRSTVAFLSKHRRPPWPMNVANLSPPGRARCEICPA
jgi:hypothetical protein